MTEEELASVRSLCAAAHLPLTEPELLVLAPLYQQLSEGIELLAEVVRDDDVPALRFLPAL